MNISLEWQFPNIELVEKNGRTDVVRSVQFRIVGKRGSQTAVREGSFILDDPSEAFVPFDQITNSMMAEWVSARFEESVGAHLSSIEFELSQTDVRIVTPHFASGQDPAQTAPSS